MAQKSKEWYATTNCNIHCTKNSLLNITCTSFHWKLLVEHARSLATIKLPQVTEVRSSLFVTGSWMISKNCALIVYVDCKQGYY